MLRQFPFHVLYLIHDQLTLRTLAIYMLLQPWVRAAAGTRKACTTIGTTMRYLPINSDALTRFCPTYKVPAAADLPNYDVTTRKTQKSRSSNYIRPVNR